MTIQEFLDEIKGYCDRNGIDPTKMKMSYVDFNPSYSCDGAWKMEHRDLPGCPPNEGLRMWNHERECDCDC